MRLIEGATVAIDETPTVLERWGDDSCLSDVERQRGGAFAYPEDRADFFAARLLARECVSRATGVSAQTVSFEQCCDRCHGPHGRPHVAGSAVNVSWSRSKGHVAAGVSEDRIGIDLERTTLPLNLTPTLLARSMTAGEIVSIESATDPVKRFRQFWVMKEAMIKVGLATLDELQLIAAIPHAGLELTDLSFSGVSVGLAIRVRPEEK